MSKHRNKNVGRRHFVPTVYSYMQQLLASPTELMPAEHRRHQLTRMWGGLAAIERDAQPSTDDWRVCSDAVNLLETMVHLEIAKDSGGLIGDAVRELAEAGQRHQRGQAIRLSAAGIQAMRAILEDYADLLNTLPARVMIYVHRQTEMRIAQALAKKPGAGVQVVDL